MNYDFQVLALGGDHIGPEVVASGLRVLHKAAQMAGLHIGVDEDLLGGASWDAHGRFCTDEVLSKARQADAILVGAVGGPEWDSLHIEGPITESDGLTRLRIELEVFNALRPARAWRALHHLTPYRSEAIDGADIMVIRENCGGIYYGEPRGREIRSDGQERAFEISEYTTSEVERIARCAFQCARNRRNQLVSLEKSNVMETGKLWRETIERIGKEEFPDVEFQSILMDYALYAVSMAPTRYDVIVTDNLFGDLISDMVGAIAGSLGMLPSATLPGPAMSGVPVKGGIYEPTRGPVGAAMCAATILGLNENQTVDALGNAGTQASGLWEFLATGTMSKHLHAGRAAESGMMAAELALAGFSGPDTILEGEKGLYAGACPDPDPSAVLANPDAEWQLLQTSIKP
ncbi:MAG: isocitrate/isopropylmalate family dehydrogenase, partial [Pseudomonadota bacterium]